MLQSNFAVSRPKLNVAVHNLRSLHNVGSIFRTASGAGFDRVFLSGYTGTPPDRRITKVALGTEEEIPWQQTADEDALIEALSGHHVVVLEQDPSSTLYSDLPLPASGELTVMLGAEIVGAPKKLIERADSIIEIPMAGLKESLNVSCAFAVVAYSLAQRCGRIGADDLLSRKEAPKLRSGVLTYGQTTGEIPNRGK